jgi:heme/copper-type cytochrome/quinol oxidase subunit 4
VINIIFPLAALMFVVGGVMFLTAGGNPGRIGTAKKIVTAVVMGIVIILVAWLIVDTVITFITPAGSPFQSWHTIDCPVP